eukprot:Hpha_TRINITY_DN4813_c0_g1::TRINITY_DN4813_c0_g1_i1::g.20355::m.20355
MDMRGPVAAERIFSHLRVDGGCFPSDEDKEWAAIRRAAGCSPPDTSWGGTDDWGATYDADLLSTLPGSGGGSVASQPQVNWGRGKHPPPPEPIPFPVTHVFPSSPPRPRSSPQRYRVPPGSSPPRHRENPSYPPRPQTAGVDTRRSMEPPFHLLTSQLQKREKEVRKVKRDLGRLYEAFKDQRHRLVNTEDELRSAQADLLDLQARHGKVLKDAAATRQSRATEASRIRASVLGTIRTRSGVRKEEK